MQKLKAYLSRRKIARLHREAQKNEKSSGDSCETLYNSTFMKRNGDSSYRKVVEDTGISWRCCDDTL